MKSSPLASRIASADTSPVVTPAHLIAAAEALLDEIHSLIDPILASAASSPSSTLKTYSNIADLRRATGLSRERICRIILHHQDKIRTIASSEYSSYKRYNTSDFIALISQIAKPKP